MYAIRSYYEYDLCKTQPLLGTGEGMSSLIKLAQSILPDTPIGSSQYGGIVNREVSIASDVRITSYNVCYTKLLR